MMDALDYQIVELFAENPKVGVLEASRRLQVARATVQSRLNKLEETGVIETWAPHFSPAAVGYTVQAFVTMEIAQIKGREELVRQLQNYPEIVEVHTVSGSADLLARVVARSNADLQLVLDDLLATGLVTRTSSSIVLQSHFKEKMLPLLQKAVENAQSED